MLSPVTCPLSESKPQDLPLLDPVHLSSCNAGVAGDIGLIPGLGRSPGEGNGNPLQYSCLENPMDRGAWWAESMRSQSQTRLSGLAHTFLCYEVSRVHVSGLGCLRGEWKGSPEKKVDSVVLAMR